MTHSVQLSWQQNRRDTEYFFNKLRTAKNRSAWPMLLENSGKRGHGIAMGSLLQLTCLLLHLLWPYFSWEILTGEVTQGARLVLIFTIKYNCEAFQLKFIAIHKRMLQELGTHILDPLKLYFENYFIVCGEDRSGEIMLYLKSFPAFLNFLTHLSQILFINTAAMQLLQMLTQSSDPCITVL